MTSLHISDFDISAERGFLTPYDMKTVVLPPDFDEILKAGKNLSGLISSNLIRTLLASLPEVDMKAHVDTLTDAQLRLLMVHYSFIVQAYVWGETEAPKVLPRNLAVPYSILSEKIGQFPLLPYSSYTLDNWAKLDEDKGVTLENIYVLQNFLGGQDENWFIMVHVEIEAKAGNALAAIPGVLDGVDEENTDKVRDNLQKVLDAWKKINPVFDRMVEKCDPYIYYNRVRPYIHGWKGNPAMPEGLIYEGVEKYKNQPQSFRGQTGSQSSIVPTMDALFQISHENDPLREYLDELHQYRPPKHRLFIEAVQNKSRLRDFVIRTKNEVLIDLYNACVDEVQKFRTRHLEYAANYINKQAKGADGNPVDVGTGGTPFMKYLKKHRDESRDHFISKENLG